MQQAVIHSTAECDAPAEIDAALARVMSSLEDLESKCRQQGADPMSIIMTAMSARAARNDAGVVTEPHAATPNDDADIAKRSRDFIEALNRCDVAAVAPVLAPGFVRFVDGDAIDRDTMLVAIVQHRPNAPLVANRTWDAERVLPKDDAFVFVGRAHEVQAGNETKGGYHHDGWYLLEWVRACDTWRVQLMTWQRETTECDRFNGIFQAGRGFSREPNRLLVETVQDETPGKALDLAMGQGRNALFLATQGWNVVGVDASVEGLRIAREQAVERDLVLETIHADIDEWDFGENRFALVTLIYAGDHAKWIDKIKATLCTGGIIVVEGWAKVSADSPSGFGEGQLAQLFDGFEILRDEIVDDVPDWAWDKGKLVHFVARKK